MTDRQRYHKLKKTLPLIDKLTNNVVRQLALLVQLRDAIQREHDRLKNRNHYY